MKSVFIAGSRKFYRDVEKLIELCNENGVKVETAGKVTNEKDTFEGEKAALLRAFKRIDGSDILFVMARGGYIGRAVALEIAYSFAKGKETISSEALEDFAARSLIKKVMGPKELVEYAK